MKTISAVLPKGAKILFVGEAPSEADERAGTPFMGASGKELQEMLAEAGISFATCARTNVFNTRPPKGSLLSWSLLRKEAQAGFNPDLPWAWIAGDSKSYVVAERVQPALVRLRQEILSLKPNLIVALGNSAMSALTGVASIGKTRGTIYSCQLAPSIKVLGTYHPSAVFMQYDLRPVVVMDLIKAAREMQFAEFKFLRRALYLEPTIDDLLDWQKRLVAAKKLAVDIETKNRQITCIGFSPSPAEAFVIPFWDRRKANHSYWQTPEEEVFAWKVVKEILDSPAEKIFQNGMYDVQYCLAYKWRINRFIHDTMLKHHSLYPALPKGLDFLGSLYCNERAWKKLRPRGGEEKREA